VLLKYFNTFVSLMDPLLHECYLHCMNLILRFVKMTYDGQLIETCRQDKNKIKYNIVFD